MGFKPLHLTVAILLTIVSIGNCFGQIYSITDSVEKEIYKLSLSELMNIKVEGVSKVSELVHEAPGVVSVITARDIEQFGATTLRDILERGVGVVGLTGFSVRDVISMRGDQILPASSHILILINGRPTRESMEGGNDSDVYSMFPINCIDQIEIIRGPGSVLYGTNAYTGIINIVTKHTNEYLSASFSGGYPSATIASVSGTANVGKGKLSGGLYLKNIQNWEQTFTLETGIDTLFNTYDKGLGANLSYNIGGLSVNSSYISGEHFLVAPEKGGNNNTFSRHFIDVGYLYQFSKKIRTTINATNTYYHSNGFPNHPERTSNDLVVELTAYIQPTSQLNIVTGTLVNHVSGIQYRLINNERIPSMPRYEHLCYSFYSQVDYRLFHTMKVIGGFQFHKFDQHVAPRFVPRLGIVFTPIEKIGIKALYAEAFRSPSANEKNLNEPLRKGNPDLKPERVKSWDIEFSYLDKKWQPALTFFSYNQHENISLDDNINPKSFINRGTFSAQGVEIEMKYAPVSNLYCIASCSYQTNLLDDSIKNSTTAPLTAKMGISYTFRSGLSIGVFNIYNSTPPDVILRFPERKIMNPVPASFNLLSANVDYNLSKVLLKTKVDIILNLRAENILNEEIYTPEWVRSRINSIPGKPGRRILFGIKINI
jgi:outer membrane receptor protein involved in Fe transport